MKKYLISTLVIFGGLYASPCNAALSLQMCPGTSIYVGTKCNTITDSAQYFPMTIDCMDRLTVQTKDTCKTYLCDGHCECRTTPCTSLIDPDPIGICDASCFTNITWETSAFSGVQTGTPTISVSSKCTNCPDKLYRCRSGYYTTDVFATLGVPDGTTSSSKLTCTECPAAADEKTDGALRPWGAPSYVASAAGLPSLTDCYIKSGASITNDVGTYEYTADCKYTN